MVNFKVCLEKMSYDYRSYSGMTVAWPVIIAMTQPLTLTLAGALTLAKIRTMARPFHSDYVHGLYMYTNSPK